MGKLTSIKPRLSAQPSRLQHHDGAERGRDQRRDEVPWRRWYKTGRWQRLRMAVLLRDLFTCQWPGCGRVEPDTSQLVADHRKPHRGDEALFWNEGNLWCLCKSCHDGAKQCQEARDR